MKPKVSKISISIIASMVIAGNALASDPAITNFIYINNVNYYGGGDEDFQSCN